MRAAKEYQSLFDGLLTYVLDSLEGVAWTKSDVAYVHDEHRSFHEELRAQNEALPEGLRLGPYTHSVRKVGDWGDFFNGALWTLGWFAWNTDYGYEIYPATVGDESLVAREHFYRPERFTPFLGAPADLLPRDSAMLLRRALLMSREASEAWAPRCPADSLLRLRDGIDSPQWYAGWEGPDGCFSGRLDARPLPWLLDEAEVPADRGPLLCGRYNSWVSYMTAWHKVNGWEPYKPMSEREPKETSDAQKD